MTSSSLYIRSLGLQDYLTCWQAMQAFTRERNETTADEIWFVQHPPVFTQGQNGRPEHLIHPGPIPIIQTDRGGQVTYHGPGQWVVYVLIDLNRLKMNVRELVSLLEQSIIQLLLQYHIAAEANPKAPGVYIDSKKICSIGLRIRKGHSYHGLALNVLMDLEPFTRINPCGFQQLKMAQLADFCPDVCMEDVAEKLTSILTANLQGKRDKLAE